MSSDLDQTLRPTGRLSVVQVFFRIAWNGLMRFWALCTTTVLILMLLYWLYSSTVAFLLLLAAAIGFCYNTQDSLLYYPEQPAHSRIFVESPGTFGLPFENVFYRTRDGQRINMILIKQPEGQFRTAHTLIFLHGNAGNIGHRLINSQAFYSYLGFNILLVEYRGYGKSSGSPSEQGLYIDAQAGMDYLLETTDVDPNKIIVFGRSLGGAVAINLACQPEYGRRIFCVILENTFTTLPAIARSLFNLKIVKYLPRWCFKNQFPSSRLVTQVKAPTLFLSGLADNLVPPSMMSQLFELSGSVLKRLGRFETGTHNETWQCMGYYDCIAHFLKEVHQTRTVMEPNQRSMFNVPLVPLDQTAISIKNV